MKSRRSPLIAAVLLIAGAAGMAAGLDVWTVAETRHVLRSDLPGKESSVRLGAARNEWISFQVLIRSDAPVRGIGLEAGDLRGPSGAVLSRSGARLYRQHQLYLEIGTHRNDSFQPDWYPDPLIPFEHPVTGKKLEAGRFAAVPFDLPAGETHGFWVDIHVPSDAAAGDYRGVWRLAAGEGFSREVPVSLTVWGFALPKTPTLVTEFGSPRLRDYYRQQAPSGGRPEPSDWDAVDAQCARLLSDHRFNATPPREVLTPKLQPDGSFEIPGDQVRALREFIDRYHVNAVQTPHPSSAVKDPEGERGKLRSWLGAFDRAAGELDRSHVLFYTYLRDEPNTIEDYRYVQKWGRAVREAGSVVKVLVVEQPWTEPGKGGANSDWGDLYGAVDIWCPLFSLHRPESAALRQAQGESVWTYTALCQGPPTPWWHIDFPLLHYRVPAWMAWCDGMKGLLYWGGMSYWRRTEDPWTVAPFYTGSGRPQQGGKGIVFQGEGSLVYPARDVGYDGVVPTIRLKALRDGIEDYEYLAILQRLGRAAEAKSMARSLAKSFFQWNPDPAAYEAVRARWAAMIVSDPRAPGRE